MTLILPPASPGFKKFNGGVIAIAAAPFIAAARAGLNTYSDPAAPGPAQVQDAQTAASKDVALDTIVIDLDTIGIETGLPYICAVSYLVLDGGSIAGQNIASVTYDGTVRIWDQGGGGESLNITAGPYGMIAPLDSDNGRVLATAAGQTLSFRAWHTGGSGSIIIDCIFLFPLYGDPEFGVWGAAETQSYTIYTTVADGPDGAGSNGMFPNSNSSGNVVDSAVVGAPSSLDEFISIAGGAVTNPNIAYVTARCTDSAKSAGTLRMFVGPTFPPTSFHDYTLPADENVYVVEFTNDPYDVATDNAVVQAFVAESGQHVRVDFLYGTDPALNPPVVPPTFVFDHKPAYRVT